VSAAVLGVLVVLWAVVLVPMWLKRHDKANELASAVRFAGAMRILARRPGRVAGRYVMMPARSAAARAPHVSAPERPLASASELHRRRAENASVARTSAETAAAYERAVRADAGGAVRMDVAPTTDPRTERLERKARTARRRQIVVAMALTLLVTVVLAVMESGFFVAVQAFVDVLVVAGLAHLRAQALADREMARRARRRSAVGGSDELQAPVAQRARTASPPPVYAEPAYGRQVQAEPAYAEPAYAGHGYTEPAYVEPAAYEAREWAYAEPAARVEEPVQRPAARAAVDRPTTAVPATAPAASRTPAARPATSRPHVAAEAARAARPARTVDLTQPGKWTEQQAGGFFVSPSRSPEVTAELAADQRAEAEALARATPSDENELAYLLGRAVGE
jgi:hypothetical protein